MSGKQISLFKSLPEQELQSYITQIQAIKSASNGMFNATAVQGYSQAIQGLEAKQAALLLSTQGLTNAQIAETLAFNESNVAKNYQAMVDAGLLKSKQSLTLAQIQSNLQTVLGAEADTSAAMASLGLSAAIEGQEHQTIQLSAKKLQEAVATNVLTEAQAQELAMRTGVILSMNKQAAGSLPKWIATLKACTIAVWGQVKATAVWLATTPAGWATAAVAALGAVIFGLNEYAKSAKKASDNAIDVYEKSKEKIQSNKEEAQSLNDLIEKYKELESASYIDFDVRAEIKEIQYDIMDLVGVEADNLDLVNGKLDEQLDKLKAIQTEKSKQNVEDAKDAYYNALRVSDIITGDADSYGNDVSVKWNGIEAGQIHKVNGFERINYKDFVDFITENGFGDIFRKNNNENIFNMKFVVDTTDIDSLEEKVARLKEFKEFLAENGLRSTGLYEGVTDAINRYEEQFDSEAEASKNLVNAVIDDLALSNEKLTEASVDSVEAFEKYRQMMIEEVQKDVSIGEMLADGILSEDGLETAVNGFMATAEEFSEWYELWKSEMFAESDTPISFDLSSYEETIDKIQESISTLRSALDALNSGELSKIEVVDLMQQFPDLVPYIDLTADGFGNLSEGLSALIEQQPDSLIQSLQDLKQSLSTDEEREQVDLLINSLQRLSSYGDTGIEAYSTSIGNTWNDTANVIENVTNQFENLAKVQEAVANGLTMSTTAAAELAKMYPEILTNAEVTANGQITLNEDVVNSILDGDKSIIDAQIAKLEADKAELIAKKTYAEAQLNIVKQVAEGEGNITKEVAQYRLSIANELLQRLIEAGMEEDRAYAAVAANMAGNMDEYNRIVGEVAEDTSSNMDAAAVSMANSININSINAQTSFDNLQKKVHDLADAIKAAANGEKTGSSGTYGGGGSTSTGGIRAKKHSGSFDTALVDYTPENINLKDFQTQLEVDIKGYTDAIANIDSQIAILKNLQTTFDNNGGIGGHGYKDKIKDLEKEKDKINDALDDAKNSAKEAEDQYEKTFDFFERRVQVLEDAFSNLEKGMENVFGADAKNTLLSAQIGILDEEINNYTDALAMYRQKANEALSGVSDDLRDKIVNGAVQITDFIGDGNEEVVEAMEAYEGWADKVVDCTQKLEELKTQIRQLELQKFNNIVEDFTNQFDIHGDAIDLISKQIGLLEEAGQLIGESFYTKQIEQSKKQLNTLEAEKTRLVEQMNEALTSGRIQKGTDEWLSMINSISHVEGNILDCKTAIEEFENELLNLNWQIFERVQTEFGNISSELDNLAGLFDDFNDIRVSDGKGTWTKQAIATLGLYAQQYELAQYQVGQYSEAIDRLNQDYAAGRYSATEYADKLADLVKGQWDAVNSAESLEDAIYDLNEIRVNEEIKVIEDEIDTYKKLTDAQVEALDAAQSLHEYEQSIAEKTKAVTDIERQLAAMQNDSTSATVAKRKQLEEQLAEAKKALSEEEYQHSIETQKNALNEQYEAFEEERNKEIEALQLTLEDKEKLIADSLEIVKANAATVGEEIAMIAQEHGVIVSDSIISAWQSGENAIASYGAVLTDQSSAFIGNIMGVQDYVYGLQAQANSTADSLSWMFSTRADNLVNELTSSYYSEANLNAMTNTLQNSLINTLERGYDVSSITSALSSIASGANSVADAANKAAQALANMGAAQSNSGAGSGSGSDSGSGDKGYKVVDTKYGRTIRTYPTRQEADDYIRSNKSTSKYFTVMKAAKGGIVTKDKNNPLNRIAESVGEDTIVAAKDGEGVLTRRQTDGLLNLTPMLEDLNKTWNMKSITGNTMPEMVKGNDRPNVNVHYDKMFEFNGDFNNSEQLLNQMQRVAKGTTTKMLNDINRDFAIHCK